MKKVTKPKPDATPTLPLDLPEPGKVYPPWVWPFVRAYERHRGVPPLREIEATVRRVRGILRPGENWFDVFAVWLYFLRDLDVGPGRVPPSLNTFATNYRIYWNHAWTPSGTAPDLGPLTSPERRRQIIRWILQEEDGGPPWDLQELMRAFRD